MGPEDISKYLINIGERLVAKEFSISLRTWWRSNRSYKKDWRRVHCYQGKQTEAENCQVYIIQGLSKKL